MVADAIDEKKHPVVDTRPRWKAYILQTVDGTRTYVGITNKKPTQRLKVHNSASNRCKKTRGRQWCLKAVIHGLGIGHKKTAEGEKSPDYARTLRFEFFLSKIMRMVVSRDTGIPRPKWTMRPPTRALHLRLSDARTLLAEEEWRDLTLALI